MFLNGRCQIFNNGNLVDYDITKLHSLTTDGGDPKKNYSNYKGWVDKKDLKKLTLNGDIKSVYVFISNKNQHYYGKIIEFSHCTIKKSYPYILPFLSKKCYVILHISFNNKTKLHESDKIFRNDKINQIISNI